MIRMHMKHAKRRLRALKERSIGSGGLTRIGKRTMIWRVRSVVLRRLAERKDEITKVKADGDQRSWRVEDLEKNLSRMIADKQRKVRKMSG